MLLTDGDGNYLETLDSDIFGMYITSDCPLCPLEDGEVLTNGFNLDHNQASQLVIELQAFIDRRKIEIADLF